MNQVRYPVPDRFMFAVDALANKLSYYRKQLEWYETAEEEYARANQYENVQYFQNAIKMLKYDINTMEALAVTMNMYPEVEEKVEGMM